MSDPIQTVRDALEHVPYTAHMVERIGAALAALDRIEAVVNAARGMFVDDEWQSYGDPRTRWAGTSLALRPALARALQSLTQETPAQEERTP